MVPLHSALGLPCQGPLYPLNNKVIDSLRNKLAEVELIVIDEISMVSQKVFLSDRDHQNAIVLCW